jgi:hypothetical protein
VVFQMRKDFLFFSDEVGEYLEKLKIAMVEGTF